jgi:hypothetical protein
MAANWQGLVVLLLMIATPITVITLLLRRRQPQPIDAARESAASATHDPPVGP